MPHNFSRRTFLAAGSAALAWAKSPSLHVGCQANAFALQAGDFPGLLKALDSMKRLDYSGFECNHRFVESEFGRSAAAREQIRATGVKFIGAHASMQQMTGPPGRAISAGVAALGAEYIVMSGQGLSQSGEFDAAALRKKAKEIESIARALQPHGLRLAYHNHNPEFANHNAEMNGLAEYTSPNLVGFLMDAGHGYLGGGDPAAFLAAHPGRIHGIHLKTFRGKAVTGQVPLGEGDFDFQDLAASIRKTNWSGWLIVEEGGGSQTGNTAALAPDRAYIRKVFGA